MQIYQPPTQLLTLDDIVSHRHYIAVTDTDIVFQVYHTSLVISLPPSNPGLAF